MSQVTTLPLGVFTVPFGPAGSPGRIRVLVGGHRQFLGGDEDLRADRFLGTDVWPEGRQERVELVAINFGRELPDFSAVQEAAKSLPVNSLRPAQFPCLARQLDNQKLAWPVESGFHRWLKGNCPPLWKRFSRFVRALNKPEIQWLALADPSSFWRDSDTDWSVPYICVERNGLTLNARSTNARWFAFTWFLFYRV